MHICLLKVRYTISYKGIVTPSTTEAEFVASVLAGIEIIWLRSLLSEFGSEIEEPSHVFIDNQSALSVAKNPKHHGRMKLLDLRYFWLREKVAQKVIRLGYEPTNSIPADLLTKALSRVEWHSNHGTFLNGKLTALSGHMMHID